VRYFLDTSALVKIYHKEEGSKYVIEIYKEGEVVISELAAIEFLSAIYRKFREKEISELALKAVCDKFSEDLEARYGLLQFSPLVIDEARNLIQKHGRSRSLKTLDSLQLAFFLVFCDKEDKFLCADKGLLEIAREEGVSVIDVKGGDGHV